jgi:hypothetical protein
MCDIIVRALESDAQSSSFGGVRGPRGLLHLGKPRGLQVGLTCEEGPQNPTTPKP